MRKKSLTFHNDRNSSFYNIKSTIINLFTQCTQYILNFFFALLYFTLLLYVYTIFCINFYKWTFYDVYSWWNAMKINNFLFFFCCFFFYCACFMFIRQRKQFYTYIFILFYFIIYIYIYMKSANNIEKHVYGRVKDDNVLYFVDEKQVHGWFDRTFVKI